MTLALKVYKTYAKNIFLKETMFVFLHLLTHSITKLQQTLLLQQCFCNILLNKKKIQRKQSYFETNY